MSLPSTLFEKRVRTELESLMEMDFLELGRFPADLSETPLRLNVFISGSARMKEGMGDCNAGRHELELTITRHYPFQPPIVRWRSPIFHPNIMPPGEGGYVCTRALVNWGFSCSLAELFEAIRSTLLAPNPDMPLGSETCMAAARFMKGMQRRASPRLDGGLGHV